MEFRGKISKKEIQGYIRINFKILIAIFFSILKDPKSEYTKKVWPPVQPDFYLYLSDSFTSQLAALPPA
jgi:hypothetical protein